MDTETVKSLLETLVQEITFEINAIKSQVVHDIVMQVAIHSHDHIGARQTAFGALSDRPSLDGDTLEGLDEVRAALLDREQRRNALKHLIHLFQEGDEEAMQLLRQQLLHFFSEEESYGFLLEPESEYPNEYARPYPYSD
jgi:hypothetical protein